MKFRLSFTVHFSLSTWLRCCLGTLALTNLALAIDVPVKSERVATLEDKRINESSGLTVGLRNPGVFWTLNDSGGGNYIFAFDRSGKTVTRCEILGATNFDWEEIAAGPGADGQPALYLADIGDNLLLRTHVVIYRIAEPHIDTAAATPAETQARDVVKLSAAYPDGCHNAEAILCHPKTGRLHIITKSEDGKCGVYSFPETVTAHGVMKMERVASIKFPALVRSGKRTKDNCMSTAACIAPDASRIAVCTYSSIYEWMLPGGDIAAAFTTPPRRIQQPLLPQCEALCYSADSKSIWLTSERLPTPLWRIEMRGKAK